MGVIWHKRGASLGIPSCIKTPLLLQNDIMAPHPFTTLDAEETRIARSVILASHPDVVVDFRETAPAAAYQDMYNNNTAASLYGGLAV